MNLIHVRSAECRLAVHHICITKCLNHLDYIKSLRMVLQDLSNSKLISMRKSLVPDKRNDVPQCSDKKCRSVCMPV